MKVAELTIEQLKTLIENTVEEILQEYIGDPDEGLELREEVIHKLKTRKKAQKPEQTLNDDTPTISLGHLSDNRAAKSRVRKHQAALF